MQAEAPVLLDRSGRSYPLSDRRWRGDDQGPLTLSPLPGLTPDQVVDGERSLWRYQAVLLIDPEHRVTLGEGLTPMIPLAWGEHRVHVELGGSTRRRRSRTGLCVGHGVAPACAGR